MTKKVLFAVGVVFVLVAVSGFINNKAFGVFETNTLQNIAYLLSGVLSWVFIRKPEPTAKTFAVVIG